jgi:hypothetical protein
LGAKRSLFFLAVCIGVTASYLQQESSISIVQIPVDFLLVISVSYAAKFLVSGRLAPSKRANVS